MAMQSRRVVIITVCVSTVFFLANLITFLASGSRAVLSQSLYAVTDIVSGVMIYWGMHTSTAPPTLIHPFGRGKERFFWAYTAGLVTFSLTGFAVFSEGLLQVISPVKITDVPIAIGVVAATLASSTISLSVILLEMRRSGSTISGLMASDHQDMKVILVQDGIAFMGAVAAITGLYLVYMTGDSRYDGYAAAVAGAMLFATGIAFALESRLLLVGKAVSVGVTKEILSIVERYTYIRAVIEMRTMLMGPEEILVTLRVNFMDDLTTDDIEMHISELRTFVKDQCPTVKYLIVEPVAERGSVARAQIEQAQETGET